MTNKSNDKDVLKKIADTLMFHTGFIKDIGLYNGQTGIAIFLYHYAKFSQQTIYSNFSDEILSIVLDKAYICKPFCFRSGMAGIGWAMEYLEQLAFIEGDMDEKLAELDSVMFKYRKIWIQEEEKNDLFGLGLYFLARLKERPLGNDNQVIQKRKETLAMLSDDCELLFENFRSGYKHVLLNIQMVNSLVYYLLQMKKLGVFEVKINKLLNQSLEFIFKTINSECRLADLQLCSEYLQNMASLSIVKDYELLNKCCYKLNSVKKGIVDGCNKSKFDNERFVLNQMIYDSNVKFRECKFLKLDSNEIEQKIHLNSKVSKDHNLGLENGLAGYGMALIMKCQNV